MDDYLIKSNGEEFALKYFEANENAISEIETIIKNENIECEFSDPDFLVMMFTPEIEEKGIERLKKTFDKINKKEEITEKPPEISKKTNRNIV